MSYDLFFRPRTGELTDSAFNAYFHDRPHYKVDSSQAWYQKLELQLQLGESKFVPRVLFARVDGKVATVAVWPDGIPIAVPDVDYFIVPRKELAPRRLLWRKQDQTLVASAAALSIFSAHQTRLANGALVLNYLDAPKDVREFVEGLPIDQRPFEGLSSDKVLDQELVEKHLG